MYNCNIIILCYNNNYKIYILLQIGKWGERARTSRMYASVASTSADRADFQQPDGDARRQETRAEKHQRSRKTRTSSGRNGSFG